MPSTGSSESRLTVRRLRTVCTLPADHPHPEACGERLEDAAGKDLSRSLSSILTRCLPADDPRIWFVKSLHVSLDINAAWEREGLASVLAARIAGELTRRLKSGATDGDCVVFPDQASWLSRYILDRAEGRAEGKWYYRAFDGLRLLSPSAAIRTALIDSPRAGREALRRLEDAEGARVTHVLTARDAATVLHRLETQTDDIREAPAVFESFADAWKRGGLNPVERDACARNALLLFIRAGGPEQVHEAGETLRPAMAVALLAHLLITGSPSIRRRLIRALRSGDETETARAVGAEDAETLAPLGHCPADSMEKTVRMFMSTIGETSVDSASEREHVSGERPSGMSPQEGVFFTPLGGMFLLLPHLARLPIDEAVEGLPALADSSPAAVVRYLVLVRCLGGGNAPGAFADPLLRRLCGVNRSIPPDEMQRWTTRVGQQRWASVRDGMTVRRREEGSISTERFILKSVGRDEERLVFLLEGRRGTWIDVLKVTGAVDEKVADAVGAFLTRGAGCTELVVDGFTGDEQRRLACRLPCDIVEAETLRLASPRPGDAPPADITARLDRQREDLEFLSFPGPWRLERSTGWIFSVMAQGVLRDFSWALPGFAASTLHYLTRNFLDMSAVVEEEPERRVVRLGRPALTIILNMTGMTRKHFTLDWLDQRPFVLYQE